MDNTREERKIERAPSLRAEAEDKHLFDLKQQLRLYALHTSLLTWLLVDILVIEYNRVIANIQVRKGLEESYWLQM